MRITVYADGQAPAIELGEHVGVDYLMGREVRELVRLGVWETGVAGAVHNWLRRAADGSVWAGGKAGMVAKMRGKGGRHLAGRSALPDDIKKKTTSIQLAAGEREKLERLAAKATAAEGKRVTISGVVERLVRHAQA